MDLSKPTGVTAKSENQPVECCPRKNNSPKILSLEIFNRSSRSQNPPALNQAENLTPPPQRDLCRYRILVPRWSGTCMIFSRSDLLCTGPLDGGLTLTPPKDEANLLPMPCAGHHSQSRCPQLQCHPP